MNIWHKAERLGGQGSGGQAQPSALAVRPGFESSRGGRYFIAYTVCFCVVFFFVFKWFLLTGKTFIWEGDGWRQHYRALVYYGKYLRAIIRGVLQEGRLVIPNWDFSIGEGGDVLQTLHYYAIGDPLALLSAVVPSKYTYYLYDFLAAFRLYLAGLMFSLLCFQFRLKNSYGVLAGSLAYVFCFWGIYNTARHPFFLNPLIYMPMMIIGFEKIIGGKRPYVLVAAVCLSACSSFYFFYMLVVLAVLYVMVRLGCMLARRDLTVKEALAALGRIAAAAVVGVLLSGVLLAPILYTFLSDSRFSKVQEMTMVVYPRYHYLSIPAMFVGSMDGGYLWSMSGIASLATLAVLLLLRERGHGELKCCLAIFAVFYLFPFFGKMMNGFSYVCNRWIWVVALAFGFMLALMWPRLLALERRQSAYLTGCCICLLLLCLVLKQSRRIDAISALAIMLTGLLVLQAWPQGAAGSGSQRGKQLLLLFLVAVSAVLTSYWENGPGDGRNYAASMITKAQAENDLNRNETQAIKAAAKGDDSFYRYGTTGEAGNTGFSAGLSATSNYWSLSNANIAAYRNQMDERTYSCYDVDNHDGRAILDAFSAAKYCVFSSSSGDIAPYGYTRLGTYVKDRYVVYENENALPLGYTYENAIDGQTWDSLTSVEKQQAMLQAVCLNDGGETVPKDQLTFTAESVPYTVDVEDGVTWQEGLFEATRSNAKATLTFSGLPNCENYLVLDNIWFDATPESIPVQRGQGTLLQNASAVFNYKIEDGSLYAAALGVNKYVGLPGQLNQYYNGRHDFIVNLGYSEQALTSVTLTFPKKGSYSFDGIQVVCQPMERFPEQIGRLREDALENVEIGTDTVRGTIGLDEPKILCLSIPYSVGWRVWVDGTEASLEQANVAYMAVRLEAGEHEIVLRYETPFLKLGAAVTAAGVLSLAALTVYTERKRKGLAQAV